MTPAYVLPLRRTRPLATLLAAALLVLFGCAQETEQVPDETSVEPATTTEITLSGQELYTTYCASCHGTEAKGDGPVAPLLTIPPPDLTQIRMRRDGDFPVDTLYQMIDGREDVQAHGTREMPIWGNNLREIDGVPQSEEAVQQRINLLIEYLRSIQVESEG